MEKSKKTREREVIRLDEEIDDIPTRDRQRTPKPSNTSFAKLPKASLTYNPDRVKSSLPMNARADYKKKPSGMRSSPK